MRGGLGIKISDVSAFEIALSDLNSSLQTGNIAAVLSPLLLGYPRVRVLRSHVGQIDAASAVGGVLVLLLVARKLAIVLLLADGAAIEVHLGLVAWSRVAEAVPVAAVHAVQVLNPRFVFQASISQAPVEASAIFASRLHPIARLVRAHLASLWLGRLQSPT